MFSAPPTLPLDCKAHNNNGGLKRMLRTALQRQPLLVALLLNLHVFLLSEGGQSSAQTAALAAGLTLNHTDAISSS